MAIRQSDPKHGSRQHLGNRAGCFNWFFLRHAMTTSAYSCHFALANAMLFAAERCEHRVMPPGFVSTPLLLWTPLSSC
jgi:hypothetical protein